MEEKLVKKQTGEYYQLKNMIFQMKELFEDPKQ